MNTSAHDEESGRLLRAAARDARTPSAALRAHGLLTTLPELGALAGTPQDPAWHPEGDVLVHSLWAADLAAADADGESMDVDRRELVVLSALLHDIGKPDTTRRIDGRLTSRGHAERGGEIVRALGSRLELPQPLTRAIAAIVETHMAHVSVRGEPSAHAVRRLVARLRAAGTSLDDWSVVVRCDSAARGPAARPDPSVAWRRVAARL